MPSIAPVRFIQGVSVTTKTGSLAYYMYNHRKNTVVTVIEKIPSQSPFDTIHTHRVIVVGNSVDSIFKVGEIIFAHEKQLCHFHPLEGIQLLPP